MKTIKSVDLWHTPEDMDELTNIIEAMSGAEKIAAWHGAMLAWNLAAKITNPTTNDEVLEDADYSATA